MSRPMQNLLLVALTLLAGCFPTLYTDAPLGEPARFEAGDWNGLWLDGDGRLSRMQVGVPDTKDFAVATDNWRECDARQAGPWDDVRWGEVRRYGEWYFPESCESRLATGKACEYWLILRRKGEVLSLHTPDKVRIRRLLDEGKVPGRIELLPSDGRQKERVVLNPQTDDHYRHLFNPETGAFPERSFLAIRLPTELDPCSKQSK